MALTCFILLALYTAQHFPLFIDQSRVTGYKMAKVCWTFAHGAP